jgi:hypothetical protein
VKANTVHFMHAADVIPSSVSQVHAPQVALVLSVAVTALTPAALGRDMNRWNFAEDERFSEPFEKSRHAHSDSFILHAFQHRKGVTVALVLGEKRSCDFELSERGSAFIDKRFTAAAIAAIVGAPAVSRLECFVVELCGGSLGRFI